MVMRPEPWGRALDAVRPPGTRLVVPTPAGQPFTQATGGRSWAAEPGLVFACGRYEGIDQRVADWAASGGPVSEVSIGDYVLAGGESAVLVMVEAVTRLLPGVVGNRESVEFDSHADGLLEGPVLHPAGVAGAGHDVPPVLLSGDHAAIARWRRAESLAAHRGPPSRPARRALPDADRDARRVPDGPGPAARVRRAGPRRTRAAVRRAARGPRHPTGRRPVLVHARRGDRAGRDRASGGCA